MLGAPVGYTQEANACNAIDPGAKRPPSTFSCPEDFVDGKVERGLDPDALRLRLQSLLLQRRTAAPRRDVGTTEIAGRV